MKVADKIRRLYPGEAELTVFDVGGGSSAALRLPDNSVFVFDCGPAKYVREVTKWLRQVDPPVIHGILISHNDTDHINGAIEILRQFGHRVRVVYTLQDRPAQELRNTLLRVLRLVGQIQTKYPIRAVRAECPTLDKPVCLYRVANNGTNDVSITLHYPDYKANLQAQSSGQPNLTSTIASVRVGRKVCWVPSDCQIDGWREIRRGSQALADLLLVPHHGGVFSTNGSNEQAYSELTTEIIRVPSHAAISTQTNRATGNSVFAETVRSLKSAGSYVVCTGLHSDCCRIRTNDGQNATSCFGTIQYTLSGDGIDIEPGEKERHKRFVMTNRTPRCLLGELKKNDD